MYIYICMYIHTYIYLYIYLRVYIRMCVCVCVCEEAWGAGVETLKKNCTTLKKSQKQKFSLAVNVGICYRITGTRFKYYISLSTLLLSCGDGTSLAQIQRKNVFETEKVKNGYRRPGYSPQPAMFLCVCIYIYIDIHTYIHIYIYIYVCKYICIYRCLCIHTQTYICIYIYIYIHINIYIHIYSYIFVY